MAFSLIYIFLEVDFFWETKYLLRLRASGKACVTLTAPPSNHRLCSAVRRPRVSRSRRSGAAGVGHASVGVHAEPPPVEGGYRSLLMSSRADAEFGVFADSRLLLSWRPLVAKKTSAYAR